MRNSGSEGNPAGTAAGAALTELLLGLPVFFFALGALVRFAQAQALLAPAHEAARYAAWTRARLGIAPPEDEVRRAAHAPTDAHWTLDQGEDVQGESMARRIAPRRWAMFAADFSGVGRAEAVARLRERGRDVPRPFPPASAASRVTVPMGSAIPARAGWSRGLGGGPSRLWDAAYETGAP